MAEQWLSIVEYARTFAVSDMTVRRRIKTGRLKAVLRDGKYYIPLGAATAFEEGLIEESVKESLAAISAPAPAPLPASVAAAPMNPLPSKPALPSAAASDDKAMQQLTRLGASFRTLPTQIAQGMQKNEKVAVDSQALLQFCDQSITRINSIERHLQESYQLRLQNIEAQLKIKDATIAQLKQQVEDLQMLVKLMEQNPKASALSRY